MNQIDSTDWLLAAVVGGLVALSFALIYFGSRKEGRKR